MKLPAHLASIFWNRDFDALDVIKDVNIIIERILIFGELEDWKWLVNNYGLDRIKQWVADNIDTTLVYFDETRVFWAKVVLNKKLQPIPPKMRWRNNMRAPRGCESVGMT